MEEIPILSSEDPQNLVKEFSAQYDAPAYIRRARQVHQAYEALLDRCRKQREEWLGMVRTRLGLLRALAGDWLRLDPLLRDVNVLRRLHDELEPRLRARIEPTRAERALRRAATALLESIERFNRRWPEYLMTVELGEVNRLRDGYNRYFLLEKECAVRSYRLAAQGYQKLEMLTPGHLLEALPLLPVPEWRS